MKIEYFAPRGMGRLPVIAGLVFLALVQTNMRPAALEGSTAAVLTHGPIAGAVTGSTARIFARTDITATVQVRYGTNPELAEAWDSVVVSTGALADYTAHVPLTDLTPDTVYYYDVLVDNVSQLGTGFAQFKTFPEAGSTRAFNFLVYTDFGLAAFDGGYTFAAREQPAFALLGGDMPHGKFFTLENKRERFKRFYSPLTSTTTREFVENVLRRYAVAHMWDDHDYGRNEGDKTYPDKKMSLQVFQEYFPTYPLTEHGDWQSFSYAQADFFLLDSRSQRDPNGEPDGPAKSMLDGDNLGKKGQLAWLKHGLAGSEAKWKFIVSPVVFNPTTKFHDGWAGFGHERNKILSFIERKGITGVVVLSGDLHIGGIDDGTHSGLTEMVTPIATGPGCLSAGQPGQWSEGVYGSNSAPCPGYSVVQVLTDPDRVRLTVKDVQGKTRIKATFLLAELN
jgi:alkaline phosphatase D